MVMLKFPVYMIDEEEEESKKNLKIETEPAIGEITLNTNTICVYRENDNGNTFCELANGNTVEIPLDIETFEDIIGECEMIINLESQISEN